MPDIVTVKWAARRVGNEGYVTEERSDGTRSEWGPMPAHTVPAFMRGRQQVIQMILRNAGYDTRKFDEENEDAIAEMFLDGPPLED